MRYIIQFVDKTSMTVSEKDGIEVGKALSAGEAIVLRGAYINPRFISIIKPIKKGWFSDDYVEQQKRAEIENPSSMKHLSDSSHDLWQ